MLREENDSLWLDFILHDKGTMKTPMGGKRFFYNPQYNLIHYDMFVGTVQEFFKQTNLSKEMKRKSKKIIKDCQKIYRIDKAYRNQC